MGPADGVQSRRAHPRPLSGARDADATCAVTLNGLASYRSHTDRKHAGDNQVSCAELGRRKLERKVMRARCAPGGWLLRPLARMAGHPSRAREPTIEDPSAACLEVFNARLPPIVHAER